MEPHREPAEICSLMASQQEAAASPAGSTAILQRAAGWLWLVSPASPRHLARPVALRGPFRSELQAGYGLYPLLPPWHLARPLALRGPFRISMPSSSMRDLCQEDLVLHLSDLACLRVELDSLLKNM